MEQIEFFDNVKTKKMKEAMITFECDCQLIYSPMTKEIFANTCPAHQFVG